LAAIAQSSVVNKDARHRKAIPQKKKNRIGNNGPKNNNKTLNQEGISLSTTGKASLPA
jgi:hypothetical protein